VSSWSSREVPGGVRLTKISCRALWTPGLFCPLWLIEISVYVSALINDMATVPYLHRYLSFYQSNTALAFAATTSGTALIIDRASAKISLQSTWQDFLKLIVALNTSLFAPPQTVYGLIGTIRLRLDTYVILVTGRESVGHLASHEVWRLTKIEIVPLRLGKGNAIQVLSKIGM